MTRAQLLPLHRTAVMGILNITPDSFSDGGQLHRGGSADLDAILHRAGDMIAEGADLLDIGGESTRPGAEPVSEEEELHRVIPVIEALKKRFAIPLSVDTSSPRVMTAAADAGASLINDVRALSRPGALEAAAASGLSLCLMHMHGEPGEMQNNPDYGDVVSEVKAYLQTRIARCEQAGIPRERLIIDPGFGFGKTLAHNRALFRALPAFVAEGLPVLVGVSRKSMIGAMLDRPVEQRLAGSVTLALLAAAKGVSIVRVHDVAETVDALATFAFMEGQCSNGANRSNGPLQG